MYQADTPKHRVIKFAGPVSLVAVLGIVAWVGAGDLNPPPGPVAPTGRFGPRTEIKTLPATITQSGSYYLGQSLSYAGAGAGITIQADDVDIDLDGFELVGAPGTGSGIHEAGGYSSVTVHDGQIRGWGFAGIELSTGHIYNMVLKQNNQDGVTLAGPSILRNVIASDNGGSGIFTCESVKLTNCVAINNALVGIITGSNSHVSDSVAAENGETGIMLGESCVLLGSTVVHNGLDGVMLFAYCEASDCSAYDNGASGLTGSGFWLDREGNHVRNCVAAENFEHGFYCALHEGNSVESCVAGNNLGHGFWNFQKVSGCLAVRNGSTGIHVYEGDCIESAALFNTAHGIEVTDYSTIVDCSAGFNGLDGIRGDRSVVMTCHVSDSGDDGIEVSNNSHVWRNHCSQNGDNGIEVTAGMNLIEGNHCLANAAAAIDTFTWAAGSPNAIFSNRETGNPGGYLLDFMSNTYGPIFAGPGPVTMAPGDQFVNVSY